MSDVFLKFCPRCGCGTKHQKLEKTGFIAQCLIAAITRLSVDLREPDCECTECGHREGETRNPARDSRDDARARANNIAASALSKAARSSRLNGR